MSQPTTRTGRQLFALLPMVYRNRDLDRGDLADFLDSAGDLLDRVRNTLDQRLADSFPEGEHAGRSAQSWLLPYFARLLDVELRSPHIDGRRAEVANAVFWRQRKGTAASIEKIAEAVGQFEAEVQEGWQRVAVTPRVDTPLQPAAAFGLDRAPDTGNPLEAAGHPGLPAVTPDFRSHARAVETESRHPLSRRTRFPQRTVDWRLRAGHGMPCFPGSYEDGSRRTPDVRTPSWSQGHFHPRRLLVFVPPPGGLFTPAGRHLSWADRGDRVADATEDGQRTIVRIETGDGASLESLTFTSNPPGFDTATTRIEGLNFNGTLTVTSGRLELRGVAARRVIVLSSGLEEPVLDAVDCLFEQVVASSGLVRLEGCTITTALTAQRLQASDSIFPEATTLIGPAPISCVRYSRIPAALELLPTTQLERAWNTTIDPVLFDFQLCSPDGGGTSRSTAWGEPGHGVLSPATRAEISAGAEDGGEMGAFHHARHHLQADAVLTKLEEFVPVGLEVALIPDPRLLIAPPKLAP